MVAKHGRGHRYKVNINALGVHVLDPLFYGGLKLGVGYSVPFAVTHGEAIAGLGFMGHAVPIAAAGNGIPEALRHQVGVNVNGTHRLSETKPAAPVRLFRPATEHRRNSG